MTRRATVLALFGFLTFAATVTAGTINVPAGGDLQAALNQAQPGDTILLAAGATYTGNFVLPAKGGTAYITIRSSAPDSVLPAAGQRITPAYASYLPKLRAPAGAGGTPPLSTAPYASYYVIEFLEFLPNPSGTGALVALGSADSTQNSLAVVPHHLVVDRCYLHGNPGVAQLRGIALNSGTTTISNNYISEIKAAGSDSQAIAGWNGPGPYTIVNNYLQAAGEVFLMGGSSMFIPNVTPSNIVFRNNYLTKDPAWRNSSWTVKNIFELKHAQDVTVDGNIFEYNWLAAQAGYAIVMTPRNQYNDNPWTVVQRVTFTNNIVRHVAGAINILGWDNVSGNQNIQTNHLTFRNNVFEDVSSSNWGGTGRLVLISETPYVTLDHNTAFNSDSAVYAYNTADYHFVLTNNIVNTAVYGLIGDGTGVGNSTVATYFPDGYFADNLFVSCGAASSYPAGNYFPGSYSTVGFLNLSGGDYHLASSSSYKTMGTDGKDPGADIDALNAALNGSAGTPTPPPPSDNAPTVSMTSPASGASVGVGATVTLAATATDGDSSPVAKVDFYSNGSLVGTATSSPYAVTIANIAVGSYSFKAVAADTAGLSATSSTVTLTVVDPNAGSGGGGTTLPTGWTDTDVGAAGMVGSASYANGTFTIKGAGADIWGTADSFNYAYQGFSGDGQVVARVTSLQNTNASAKAGVMLRESVNAGSISVLLNLKAGGGMEMLVRSATNGSTAYIAGAASGSAPVWLKLTRSGTTVTGYMSTDGATWTTVGKTTLAMATTITSGLAVCSYKTSVLNTAMFDNVSVAPLAYTPPPSTTPSPLADQDIGGVGMPGSMTYSGGTYTIKGAGADIWGTSDSFNFAYQALSGNGQIVARVVSLQNTNSAAKAGVMIRESLATGSSSVLLNLKPAGGTELLVRASTGGSTSYLGGNSAAAPEWLKLVRSGTTITASSSPDGTTWTTVGAATVSMATNVYIGLAVCSHNTSALNTSTFDNVTISAAGTTPPPSTPTYSDLDVGSTGLAGSSSVSNGIYTVKGAGADVWGTADSFHFAYQSLGGDGQMVARVLSLQNTASNAKAGVMIRESLTAGSSSVLLNVKPSGGTELLARTSTNGSTSYVGGNTAAAPVWLKLVRSGTTITASSSTDGSTWTTVGTVTVSMASNVYVGLAVCSHTTSALNTATFDNVSFK